MMIRKKKRIAGIMVDHYKYDWIDGLNNFTTFSIFLLIIPVIILSSMIITYLLIKLL